MTDSRPIPFFDLTRQYQTLEPDILPVLLPLMKSQQFILGPAVNDFERLFSRTFESRYGIGLSSGTDALVLALRASGLSGGDGVLVPSFTFFASGSSVSLAGGRPIFVDVDRDSFLLTPSVLRDFLGERTTPGPDGNPVVKGTGMRVSGLMAVHLYGQMADMGRLARIAAEHNLFIVEDACQAVGARRDGHYPGVHSNAAAYSFFPTKNLGGFGDGGMVTTEKDSIDARIRRLRVHGSEKRYEHLEIGVNARLDALQAAVLSVKLPYLPRWTRRRQEIAARYNDALSGLDGVGLPRPEPGSTHVYHQYTIRVEGTGRRNRLKEFLAARGIGSEIYYPIPLHKQPAFPAESPFQPSLPVSELLSEQVISLPVFPELLPEEQDRVIHAVRECLS